MNRVQMTIIWSLSIVFFVSCESAGDKRLDFALEQAGKNRIELEKVLNYYRNDSLKLEAARFLIRNMPGHGGYEDDRLDSVKAVMKAAVELNIGGYLPDSEWKRKWIGFNYRTLPKRPDIEYMSADYLIENIEQSFKVWEECPWAKNYSFDDFCEWVLPYRIGDEPLDNWRKMYYDRYKPLLDSLYTGNDMVPNQFSHNLALSYSLRNGRYNLSFECRNFTNEKLYDNFSLQKPGRAFYGKVRVYFGN